MILVIGDRHYPHVNVEDLSLSHVMALQRELTLTNISSCQTWADVRAMLDDYQQHPAKDRANHPEHLFLLSLTVWACRVAAGDQVTLLEAVDVPVSQVRFMMEPHDRLQEAEPGPKATTPTGSVRGAGHRRAGGKKRAKR